MARTIWFDSYESGELADTSKFQSLKYSSNKVIRYVRAVLVFVGAPAFTSMQMKVYANDENAANNSPSTLLHTSTNGWSYSDLMTLDHGWKDIYFKFTDFQMKAGVYYNFVINASGYSPTSSSYVGLELEFPNPIHRENYTPTYVNWGFSPYKIYAIGDDL